MPEYIFLMHGDANDDETAWEPYLRRFEAFAWLEDVEHG